MLGTGTALMGQQALRAVTNAGFDFWLRYGYSSAVVELSGQSVDSMA